jgi:hypothetical protein
MLGERMQRLHKHPIQRRCLKNKHRVFQQNTTKATMETFSSYELFEWVDNKKIYWNYLSLNPAAIHLLEKNKDKIDWYILSLNPSIFTYDYERIKKNFEELGEEIIAKALHPKRIFRLIEEYGEDEIYDIYFE